MLGDLWDYNSQYWSLEDIGMDIASKGTLERWSIWEVILFSEVSVIRMIGLPGTRRASHMSNMGL